MWQNITHVRAAEWILWFGAGGISWLLFGISGPVVFSTVFLARVLGGVRTQESGERDNEAMKFLKELESYEGKGSYIEWVRDQDDRWSHLDRPQ